MTETRGFFYVASGAKYVAEGDADVIIPIETNTRANAVKVSNLPRTPFDRTVYLDTDTFVIANVSDMFDLLDSYDLAATHAAGYAGLPEETVPAAFNELNGGVVVYRRSPAVWAFLEDWRAAYLRGMEPGSGARRPKADQPTFRLTAWQHRLAVYVLPPEYNYRPGFAGVLRGRARIVHGRMHDMDSVIATLNEKTGARAFGPFRRAGAAEAAWGIPIGGFATLGRHNDTSG